eukprot:14448686-Heterocapsa_arctica.AAC.1
MSTRTVLSVSLICRCRRGLFDVDADLSKLFKDLSMSMRICSELFTDCSMSMRICRCRHGLFDVDANICLLWHVCCYITPSFPPTVWGKRSYPLGQNVALQS